MRFFSEYIGHGKLYDGMSAFSWIFGMQLKLTKIQGTRVIFCLSESM